jgi:hypothetical protein
MKEKNKIKILSPSDIKTCYKSKLIQAVWYWAQDKEVNQWNIIVSPEMNPYVI